MTASQPNRSTPQGSPWIERLEGIDAEIVRLLNLRTGLIGAIESSATGDSMQSLRELQHWVMTSRSAHATEHLDQETVRRALTFLSGVSYQATAKRVRIAYLGPEHSYSYLAACKFFGVLDGMSGVSSIGAVFDEIARGQSTYGVVPIENSTDGRIVDTMNRFIQSPISICGEVLLPIHHNLIANCRRDEIVEIYSKPQALSQCRAWLSEHVPNARQIEVASTTAAAKIAAERPHAAAVASLEAARHHGLELLAPNIEDNPNNVTRFAVIGHESPQPSGTDKTSILFQVPHKPGALADVMVMLRDNGLNLTWIESFPVPGVSSEYYFFVELEGHIQHPSVSSAMAQLKQTALRFDFLGSYPKGILS